MWPLQYINADTGKEYRSHNEDERLFVFRDSPRHALLKGGEGGGKALALDTPLPTPTGWTTMGDVRVGDRLLDECGIPCCVIATSPVMNGHVCYRVVFDDGRFLIADAEHLWLTTDSRARKSLARRGEKYVDGSMARLPHCQPKYDPEVRTTEQIKGALLDCRGFTNYSVEIAAPLDLPDAELPIDPYTLGAWLGDGTSRYASITIGNEDRDEMISLLEAEGHVIIPREHSSMSFGIDTDVPVLRNASTGRFIRNGNCLYAKLDGLGVLENKHIPAIYLRASYTQRLALLQGLMDTDGHADKRGKCEYTSCNERLALDVEELCLSLGIKVSARKGYVRFRGKKIDRWRINFTPYILVFRLSRKNGRLRDAGRHAARQKRRYIVAVDPYPSVPVKCVAVDSPSRLYLAGSGMIPTHNSVAGIIKTLNRIRRGMDGAMLSPDLEHFKRSLWPEFVRWCPWETVIPRHQHRKEAGWMPSSTFVMTFRNEQGGYSDLWCGGILEAGAWEGPNLSFAHMDEARRHRTPAALKVLTGRVRISGPNGEPPQIYLTTTPRKHWLFDFFGGMEQDRIVTSVPNDPHYDFKLASYVGTIQVALNAPNLDPDFLKQRALSLTEKERRVVMDAEWEDEEEVQKFVNIAWWDACTEPTTAWSRSEPTVIALDAATGGSTATADCFAVIAVTRHPQRRKDIMIRYCGIWQPPPGREFDSFDPMLDEVERLCREFSVIEVCYDKYQLFSDMKRLKVKGINVKDFPQGQERLVADKQLQQLIMGRRIAHDGNPLLRQHIDNADFKKHGEDGIRVVKRNESQKVDGCVATSMAASRILYFAVE